ncbi:alpha/beta fold hydrolase [Microlunatus elymi]|uniref:Alpha/beta fold hydrolase n=1 Tax=Microlunatus elymi TaxID=2596828 RepID=A0A516Q2Y5_9ACTN|nr:alpha/beta fold hydrolase [Microlunatus elymi]QDP97778.1 alpha/beta fold hydrolase [Microlunatus elymi]
MVQTRDPRFPDPSRTGTVPFRGHRTWYRVTGDLDHRSERAPLVVLHGGPGAAHNYTLMMANLANQGRAVIHYDQLGCGESTHLPEAPADFWTVQLFVDELRAVVDHLGVGDRFHLLGQSWGGMLAPEVVLSDPTGWTTCWSRPCCTCSRPSRCRASSRRCRSGRGSSSSC